MNRDVHTNEDTDGQCAERAHPRDALCLLVGCMLAVLDEAPSYEERQQSLEGCIDLLKHVPDRTRANDRL